MRRSSLDALKRSLPGETVAEAALDDPARVAMVKRFGPACAAWLVSRHRSSIRVRGVVDFHIARHRLSRLPMWFAFAVEFLGRRPWWEVRRVEERGVVVWRVVWRGWGYWRELVVRVRCPS